MSAIDVVFFLTLTDLCEGSPQSGSVTGEGRAEE